MSTENPEQNSKQPKERNFIKSIILLAVGAGLTLLGSNGMIYITNTNFVVPAMKGNLLIEIEANQKKLNGLIPTIEGSLNDVENKVHYIDLFGPEKTISNSIYNSYLDEIGLLPEGMRRKLITYYLNLESIDNIRNGVIGTFDRYNRIPQLASEENLKKSLIDLLSAVNVLLNQGSILMNELNQEKISNEK